MTPSDGSGLVVHEATIPFGSRDGLRGLNLRVAAGERVALLGPSGVGKTTLLRAIAGLDPTTSGTIRVAGRDVTGAPPDKRSVVYLHQTPTLFPHLSVLDNVGFPLEVRGLRRAEARVRAGALLERVQLSGLAARSATALSGGQRHRVALARALAAEPAVLLLDEPFNALDPALRADVRDAVFTTLVGSGAPGIVLVTHDVDEAVALSGRVAVLLDGRIVQDATPSVLLTRPASIAIATFLGVPNVVHGRCTPAGVFECPLGTFPASLHSGAAALVARPDAFLVQRAGAPPAARGVVGVVTEIRERVSGALACVRVAGVAAPLLVQRGSDVLQVGETVQLTAVVDRVHVVPTGPAGARDV